MIGLYRHLTRLFAPTFDWVLQTRLRKGKEHPQRINERRGLATIARPKGKLIWLHAASVGEAQSALILITTLLEHHPKTHILITTGTLTSAQLMEQKLPKRAIHQFIPLDRPDWVNAFLSHWQPDLVLWLESEFWPNLLDAIKAHNIPAALINGRMSRRSARRWSYFKQDIQSLLQTFTLILAQSDQDAAIFKQLGHTNIHTTGTLKYSAAPLPVDKKALKALQTKRPLWLYASTHDGEEQLACETHAKLQDKYPDLLTIIVPRHPERREEIVKSCARFTTALRSQNQPITPETQIYIADTLGELGLFYALAPIAVIGRSFSFDGGGGHNPIEAAQLGAAVLTGANIQYQREIFDPMIAENAAILLQHKQDLAPALDELLTNPKALKSQQKRGLDFVTTKTQIIDKVVTQLTPLLKETLS